jgi:hypothetical protein
MKQFMALINPIQMGPKTAEEGTSTGAFIANVTVLGGGVEGPVDPGFGGGHPGGVDPGYGRPDWAPARPGHDLPGSGGLRPDHDLPRPPGHVGGGPITPPMYPSGQPLPPGVPEKPPTTKPIEPGEVYPPLAPGAPPVGLALVWLVGVGYRWVNLGPTVTPS